MGNTVQGKKERIGRMLQMHANERTEVKEARAGDIVAIVGLKDTTTGDTLSDPDNRVILERMDFPDPVIKVSVEPASKAEQDKMGLALNRLAKEDPSFRYRRDEETGQTVIEGMGELHLDIIVDRMKREFKVKCNVGEPQVAYRESITGSTQIEYQHKKQSGGSGQYAKVFINFAPLTEDDKKTEEGDEEVEGDFKFVNEIKGGVIPKEYIPGVQKGIESTLSNGVIAGYPMTGVKATLYDGAFHDVDSSVLAFEIAGRAATKQGLKKCQPRLMEPIMKVDVITPEEFMGDIIGDINSRRGLVAELSERGNFKTVQARVPLAQMFQYVSDLRSMSKGRAQYSMVFDSYELVPPNLDKDVTEKYKAKVVAEDLLGQDPKGSVVNVNMSVVALIFGFAAGSGVILTILVALKRIGTSTVVKS